MRKPSKFTTTNRFYYSLEEYLYVNKGELDYIFKTWKWKIKALYLMTAVSKRGGFRDFALKSCIDMWISQFEANIRMDFIKNDGKITPEYRPEEQKYNRKQLNQLEGERRFSFEDYYQIMVSRFLLKKSLI